MRFSKALLLTVPVVLLATTEARDAQACGGCFVQQSENTQVTGHKMILSISNERTTLWDQIEYSGNPKSFAWVLPIHGIAEVGLSSDALFQTIDQDTQVTVSSPIINCAPPQCNNLNAAGGDGFSSGAGGGSGGGEVTVIAHDVVGPFETVQLKSSDPAALEAWLAQQGYSIPADVQPIINQYVDEGFNFLAMKLLPNEGISSMKPVRITTQGASPVLPLRMVAAGTGAITPITLWVMGEGRYQPSNLPWFTIDGSLLVWNWDSQSSNYAVMKQARFDETQNKGWLVEAAEPTSTYDFSYLAEQADYDPAGSGYGDDMHTPVEAANADLDKLYGSIDETSLWVTRLHGELSRAALVADLELEASSDQSAVERYFQLDLAIGTPPECPVQPPCGDDDTNGWSFWGVGPAHTGGGSSSCAMSEGGGAPALGLLALAATLALSRRRRARRS